MWNVREREGDVFVSSLSTWGHGGVISSEQILWFGWEAWRNPGVTQMGTQILSWGKCLA